MINVIRGVLGGIFAIMFGNITGLILELLNNPQTIERFGPDKWARLIFVSGLIVLVEVYVHLNDRLGMEESENDAQKLKRYAGYYFVALLTALLVTYKPM